MKSLVRALDLVAAAFVAFAVAATILGGVVTFALNRAGLLWPYYAALTGVAVAALISMPPRRWLRWGPWAFFAPVGVLLAWLPYAVGVAPDARAADIEVRRLLQALLIAAIVFAPVRGSRAGMTGLRVGWAAALAASVGIGLWEIVTAQHLPLDPRGWVFGPARLAVGTFVNPNNFATGLVGMIAGTLALRAGVPWRWVRVALDVLVGLGAVVVVFTQSRAGLGALLVVFALEVWRRWGARQAAGVSTGAPFAEVVRHPGRQRRLPGVGAGLFAVIVLAPVMVLASVIVPALATRNPLVQLWRITFTDETARSDGLRLGLIRAALRYLRDSGWLGAGAGSFEPLLWSDPDPGVVKLTNLHNAFVEVLSQYGVVVAGVHTVATLGLLGVVLRHGRAGRGVHDGHGGHGGHGGHVGRVGHGGRPDLPDQPWRDTRIEIAGYLMAYVAFGITASSSLTTPSWWLLYASACAAWWAAPGLRLPSPPPQSPTALATDPNSR